MVVRGLSEPWLGFIFIQRGVFISRQRIICAVSVSLSGERYQVAVGTQSAYLLPSVLQPQTLDVDLALGEADVELEILLEGDFELGQDVQTFD